MKEKNQKSLFHKPHIIAAVCFALLVIVAFAVAIFNQESKPDPESERRIRKAVALQLKKDPNELTDEDFASIIKLRVTTYTSKKIEVSDIKFLEKLINLEELILERFKFPESKIPKWIKILTSLGIYNLNEKYTIDLKPLEKLAKLESLNIIESNVTDLEPLKELNNLKRLNLYGSKISNLEPIKRFKKLQSLDLRACENISDKQIDDLRKALPYLFIYITPAGTGIIS